MKKYGLDADAAKRANDGGKRISQPGQYVGKFIQAWYEVNKNKTEGVFLTFESDAGQTANLRLYTHNADGEELPSYKTLNAVLAVLRLKGIEGKKGKVTVFDGKNDVEQDAETFPTMLGKPIGLLLQTEEYTNSKDEVKNQVNLYAPFCPEKKATAAEIIDKAVNGGLDKLLEQFKLYEHKPLKGSGRSSGSGSGAKSEGGKKSEFAEDDIPF